MKVQQSNYLHFLQNNHERFKVIFLYGHNSGLINLFYEETIKILKININDPFNIAKIDNDNLKDNPTVLKDNLKTINIFGDKRIIICNLLHTTFTKSLENLFLNNIQENNDDCILIVKADNINKQSQLVKYLENSDNCILAPCYEEETFSIKNKILHIFNKHNYSYTNEFLVHFVNKFSSNSLINNTEFEKLELLLAENSLVPEHTLLSFITNNEDKNFDKIINLCASGEAKNSLKLFSRIYDNTSSNVAIVRKFGNHFKIIETIILQQKKGWKLQDAVNRIKPPIFFKNKPRLTYQCTLWSLKKINLVLKKLIDLELKCKMNLYPEKTIISQFILYASSLAVRKTKT